MKISGEQAGTKALKQEQAKGSQAAERQLTGLEQNEGTETEMGLHRDL